MHADIGDPNDAPTMACFGEVLAALNAQKVGHDWAIGVDHWQYRVGSDALSVFADSWSVDVEGPPELVARVIAALQQKLAEPRAAADQPAAE